MLTIGIEAERANNPTKTGVEHYARQLIEHLAKIDSKNQYVLYLRTKPQQWILQLPQNFQIKLIPFPIFWTQIRLSFEMLVRPVDVLLIPASALPMIHPKNSMVTIHDLAWKFYPESFTLANRLFLDFSTRYAVRRASKIIAVSENTKNDIEKFYGTEPGKITVIHHGFENFKVNEKKVETKINLPEKFVLFLSTLQPRKNLEGLIKAFKELKKECPELTHKLVVVGKPGWKFSSILKTIEENQDIVMYLNYVSDEDRMEILKKAELLALPSFYEGFGMQILEAFALKVPVITSNVSSMPEIAGEAAIYFDPKNIPEIKNALKMCLYDKSLRESLVSKASNRLKEFSWEKCANETYELITSK